MANGRLDQLEDRLSGTQEAGGSNPPTSTYSLESDCSLFLSSLASYAISALGMMNSAWNLEEMMLIRYQPIERTGVTAIIVKANHMYKFPCVAV